MNAKLKKFGIFAAALVLFMATGQAGVAEPVHADTGAFLAVSFTGNAASLRISPRLNGPADLSPLAPDALGPTDETLNEQLPFSQYSVRLYPIENANASARMAAGPAVLQSAPSPRAGRNDAQGDRPSAKKTSLPEPDSWAMLVAGLLGVGAIARRRMSA